MTLPTARARALVAAVVALGALLTTSPAAAYCRKTTGSGASEASDPARTGTCDPAPEGALPLYWAKTCVEYAIVVDPVLEAQGKMTTARASEIVRRASGAWTDVQCASARGGTQPVAIRAVDVARGRCPGARGATRNEVRFTTEPSDGDVLAVTNMTFDAKSGGLFTAVTRVSDVYAELGSTPAAVDAHLEYVVRHEMGHFLGLAHSERSDAVMNATFRTHAGDELGDDDVRGICDVYDPDAPIGAGCTAAGASRGRGGSVLAALAMLAASCMLFRRRRAAWLGAATLLVATSANAAEVPPPSPPAPTEIYVGGGYRAFVLPRMLTGVAFRSNTDPIFHAASIQTTFRKSGFSLVPSITFADLRTGDMLVGSRSAERASSFSYVRSDLSALAASIELVWALPISRRIEFELGLELGAGVTFGRLVENWVYESASGSLEDGGRRFAPCRTVNDGVGCRPQDHASPTPVRVGDYAEKGLFAGGSAPTLLPWVSLPLLGVRARVTRDLALRFGVGASATGLWAGASLAYAVTKPASP